MDKMELITSQDLTYGYIHTTLDKEMNLHQQTQEKDSTDWTICVGSPVHGWVQGAGKVNANHFGLESNENTVA